MADKKRHSDRDIMDGAKPRFDDPPNSRLFIVCSKNITEDDFRASFERFGHIEEIWVVKDRNTGEPKGVTYIKFSKTSEAALALEEMNGKCIGSGNRPLKVMIAHSRDQGSKRETNEEERLLRLFCVVPKTTTDQMLRDHFKQFGDIDYVSVVKDRETKESRGFAYVKFHKISHAAKAFENCDRNYKAVFAEPRKKNSYDSFDRYSGYSGPSIGHEPLLNPFSSKEMNNYQNVDNCLSLRVIASPLLNQDQLWKLFDIVPGMDFLYLDPKARLGKGHAVVVYASPEAAVYACDKLHGFEYPPGQRLIVKLDPSARNDVPLSIQSRGGGMSRDPFPGATSPRLPGSTNISPRSTNLPTDLASLAETIAQATSLIQAAGLTPDGSGSLSNLQSRETYDPSYCSVKLPPPQPLASMDAETAERLFIVCNPGPPPPYALRDVFGRFGNLIDVYMLSGKNCGYAKYASKESAENAIQTLHGQEVCGVRMKVMAADPRTDDRRKRIKMDDQ